MKRVRIKGMTRVDDRLIVSGSLLNDQIIFSVAKSSLGVTSLRVLKLKVNRRQEIPFLTCLLNYKGLRGIALKYRLILDPYSNHVWGDVMGRIAAPRLKVPK